ncbi:MAG: RNA polymerase sigma factor [Planctomycetaceae bacterium]
MELTDSTSASLIRRISDPADANAWERFAEIYAPLILRWLDSRGIQARDAEDITQNVMVRLHSQLQKGWEYDESKSFRGLLRTMSRQGVSNYYRDRKKPHISAELEAAISTEDRTGVFEQQEFENYVISRGFGQIRGEFSPVAVSAFLMCQKDGRSAREAGEMVGMTPGAIRTSNSRILHRLRELVSGMLD